MRKDGGRCADLLQSAVNGTSPFRRGIICDWYDGEVSGVLECGVQVYAFHMVAWDDRRRRRIFVLRPLPRDAYELLEAAFADAGDPRSSWWAPVGFSSEAERDRASKEADRILSLAGNVEYLVLSTDLSSTLDLVRPVKENERPRIQALLRSAPSEEDGLSFSDQGFDYWLTLVRKMA